MAISTIAAALEAAIKKLSAAGVENPKLDSKLLLCHAADIEPVELITNSNRQLPAQNLQSFEALIKRRVLREPVSHLIGEREFWSLPFLVSSDVLDPRPSSETLIQAALKYVEDTKKVFSVLDLGTGSGCLLITILKECPLATGIGIDNSEAALLVARQNAAKHSVENRSKFEFSSWGRNLNESFDLILCNPPYIADGELVLLEPEVIVYEPRMALFAGDDGLSAFRDLAPDIYRLLNLDGVAVLECGLGQETSLVEIFSSAGLKHLETLPDLEGIERCCVFSRKER